MFYYETSLKKLCEFFNLLSAVWAYQKPGVPLIKWTLVEEPVWHEGCSIRGRKVQSSGTFWNLWSAGGREGCATRIKALWFCSKFNRSSFPPRAPRSVSALTGRHVSYLGSGMREVRVGVANHPSTFTLVHRDKQMTAQNITNGRVSHEMGTGKEAGKKVFTVKYRPNGEDGPQVSRQYTNIRVNVPVSEEALAQAFSKYTFTVGGVKLTGVHAAAAAKFIHAVESVRGDVRKALESGLAADESTVRRMFAEYQGPSGERGGFKQVQVSEEKVAEFVANGDHAGLMAYLAQQGAKAQAVEESPEDLDDEEVVS